MDVSKLSPAPWVAARNELIGGWAVYPPREEPGTGREVADFTDEENAGFIALARNALDVMLRRSWGIRRSTYDGLWWLEAHAPIPRAFENWVAEHGFSDPFTALVEADRWYRKNVENAHEDEPTGVPHDQTS